MTVIAMTRELGSFGMDVATGLAAALNLEVVHHEWVEHQVAEKLKTSDALVHRYLEGEASLFERWRVDGAKLSRFTAEMILEQVARGNVVIRGWGAIGLLRPVSHVLRVRVCAPLPVRVERTMQRLGLADAAAARREIERSDAAHAGIAQRLLGSDWQSPDHYHVILNTARLPIDTCVAHITQLARGNHCAETEDSRATLHDLLVTTRIRIALDRALGSHHRVDVTLAKGEAVVTGMPGDQALVMQAVGLVRRVKGVERASLGLPARRQPGSVGP